MALYLGLDCGGSSTRSLAVNAGGATVHSGSSGSANLATVPRDTVRKHLDAALQGCPEPDYVAGCFAGLIDYRTRALAIELLTSRFGQAKVVAQPDFAAALLACPEGTDICVIAGTGSVVCSLGMNGMVKSGGRGYLLGDAGSAYQFGRDALRAYLQAPNESSDELSLAVRSNFPSLDEAEILSHLYRQTAPAKLLSRLAPAVGYDAALGREYALQSIERNLGELIDIVAGHLASHLPGRQSIQVSLAGGLWRAHRWFQPAFTMALRMRHSSIEWTVVRQAKAAVWGAVELARRLESQNNHGH